MPEPVIAEVTQEELPQAITEDVERSLDDNPQDALARLREWKLERDDSGDFRVYRDTEGRRAVKTSAQTAELECHARQLPG